MLSPVASPRPTRAPPVSPPARVRPRRVASPFSRRCYFLGVGGGSPLPPRLRRLRLRELARRPGIALAALAADAADDDARAFDAPPGTPSPARFAFGCGAGDVTGPIDGVGMMGYARPDQKTRGLWQRQWARAFIFAPGASSFADAPQPIPSLATPLFTSADADSLVALVVVDSCMIFPEVKSEALRLVADRLARRAKRAAARARAADDDASPPEDLLAADLPEVLDDVFDVSPFTEANVAVSATHAHSAAGGFSSHALYNVTVGGAVGETREALVYGIADALVDALDDCAFNLGRDAIVSLARTEVGVGASANRSKPAYAKNPAAERARYSQGDADRRMTVLFATRPRRAFGYDADAEHLPETYVGRDPDGPTECAVAGALAWFAVHGTSLGNANRLVSGDNKGVAAWLAETVLRAPSVEERVAGKEALKEAFGTLGEGEEGDEGEASEASEADSADSANSANSADSADSRASSRAPRRRFVGPRRRFANAAAECAGAVQGAVGFTRAGRAGPGVAHGAIVAFPQGASGDVTPNAVGAFEVGPRWQRGANAKAKGPSARGTPFASDGALRLESVACDGSCAESLSGGRVTRCVGFGPGLEDDAAGCVATGATQAVAALAALERGGAAGTNRPGDGKSSSDGKSESKSDADEPDVDVLDGPPAVAHAHAWIPIGREPFVRVDERFTRAGAGAARTSAPALGYSFAAGTTDGPGRDGFAQGDRLPGFFVDDENEEEEDRDAASFSPDAAASSSGNEPNGAERPKKKGRTFRFVGALASWAASGFRRFGVPLGVREAHAPKPVLLHLPAPPSGDGSKDATLSTRARRETPSSSKCGWVAADAPVSVFRVGRALIANVPAEVSVMAGRRLEAVVKRAAREAAEEEEEEGGGGGGQGGRSWRVIVNTLANGYCGYVVTPEEYGAQRYEGASCLYGPETLGAFAQTLDSLARETVRKSFGRTSEDGVDVRPADPSSCDLHRPACADAEAPRDGPGARIPPADLRWPPLAPMATCLGDVPTQAVFVAGADERSLGVVKTTFLCGRPRRMLTPPPYGSLFVVERLLRGNGYDGLDLAQPRWVVVATDDDLCTEIEWAPAGPLGWSNRLTFTWRVPAHTPTGTYRIGIKTVARGFRRLVTGKGPLLYENWSGNFRVRQEWEDDRYFVVDDERWKRENGYYDEEEGPEGDGGSSEEGERGGVPGGETARA